MYPAQSMPPAPLRSGRHSRWRFVGAFLATAVAGCLLLAGLNFIVNPLGYYPVHLIRPLAWGDRQIKVDLMRRSPPPEVLVLGSSRTMTLAPTDIQRLTGHSAFNAGVSSGLPEDMDALFRYATAGLHWRPRELIVGIDLQALDASKQLDNGLPATPALRRYLPWPLRWQGLRASLAALLSVQHTGRSLQALAYAVKGYPPDTVSFDPDGLLHYRTLDQQIAAGSFYPDVQTYIPFYERLNSGFRGLDPGRLQMLERLVQDAGAQGIRVRAFITPYHPEILSAMRQVPAFQGVLGDLHTFLGGLQTRAPGFTWQDFSDIGAFGGDPSRFYDGIGHLQPENSSRLLAQLLRER